MGRVGRDATWRTESLLRGEDASGKSRRVGPGREHRGSPRLVGHRPGEARETPSPKRKRRPRPEDPHRAQTYLEGPAPTSGRRDGPPTREGQETFTADTFVVTVRVRDECVFRGLSRQRAATTVTGGPAPPVRHRSGRCLLRDPLDTPVNGGQ